MNRLEYKKVIKKICSVALATVFATGCIFATGCDGVYVNTKETESTDGIVKPKSISIVASSMMNLDLDDVKEFEEYLEGLLANYGDSGNIDLDIVVPGNERFPDYYAATGNHWIPDVILLSAEDYSIYAACDGLWDMTEVWEKSQTSNSDRLTERGREIISSLYVKGSDKMERIYGLSVNRGNGFCTYVKSDWLQKAGIDKSSIEDKTLSFNEYYDMLKKLKASSGSDFVISPPGFVANEPPYTHYLPEFYQDAHYSFYKNEAGEYVDGFSEQAMIDALKRIERAVEDGIIDSDVKTYSTSRAREYFYSTDPKEESGVLTYLAGKWAETLSSEIGGLVRADGSVMSRELIPIKPIAELGAYVERNAPVWCITKECENPEGVYKYFIDTMLDGGDIQLAWQYGVKGTHWDDDSERVSINHIDPLLCVAPIENDPGADKRATEVKESAELFYNNSVIYERLPYTEEYWSELASINEYRQDIIYKVVTDPDYTAEQGIADYKADLGKWVYEVLWSFRKLED